MINLNTIKTYMYCPLNLYYQKNIQKNEENKRYKFNKEIKELRIDIKDIIQKNLKRINKSMTVETIEEELNKNIKYYIITRLNEIFKYKEYDNVDFEKYKVDLLEESKFNIKLLSIRVKRFMILTNKNGYDINKIIYPTSMYNYFLRDSQLDINGTIDKIEIIKGKYYPIIYKFNTPPIQGVWDNDAIEIACNSILIEEEFETDVYVGFVEYLNFAERRTVVVDANLRKSLFRILDYIKRIIINNEIPTVRYELNKCKKCEYKEICQEEFTNPIDM